MGKKKVLFISQEIFPYLPETQMSVISRNLPQEMQESGNDIRIFMPKYGIINERRHQLHEVIRLSRMNLIVDDFDHQLIIKVASIQAARIQVYFIDNEDYFPRKQFFHDSNGKFFRNNDERMIFFCKGVIETVRKLGWSPDVIHCHGWVTSLVPLYIKKLYSQDPLFVNTKIVSSLYDNLFKGSLNNQIVDKLLFEDALALNDLKELRSPNALSLIKFAIKYSDGIVLAGDKIKSKTNNYIQNLRKPILECSKAEDTAHIYNEFYEGLFENEKVGELELTN